LFKIVAPSPLVVNLCQSYHINELSQTLPCEILMTVIRVGLPVGLVIGSVAEFSKVWWDLRPMTLSLEIAGGINWLHISGAVFWYVCHANLGIGFVWYQILASIRTLLYSKPEAVVQCTWLKWRLLRLFSSAASSVSTLLSTVLLFVFFSAPETFVPEYQTHMERKPAKIPKDAQKYSVDLLSGFLVHVSWALIVT